jgi:hypothetical protein
MGELQPTVSNTLKQESTPQSRIALERLVFFAVQLETVFYF